jgi:hypothetical protein
MESKFAYGSRLFQARSKPSNRSSPQTNLYEHFTQAPNMDERREETPKTNNCPLPCGYSRSFPGQSVIGEGHCSRQSGTYVCGRPGVPVQQRAAIDAPLLLHKHGTLYILTSSLVICVFILTRGGARSDATFLVW